MEKGININGAVLDKTQMKQYLEKIASDHIVIKNSNKLTFPIPRLLNNYEYITKTYNILTEHLKLGILIHPAGEWLLDNYYVIEESVKEIKKELTLKKYVQYLGIDNGKYKGYARIYLLACEIVGHADGVINEENLIDYLIAYQKNKMLNMEEIWGINLFIKIALIENIRNICEKIYLAQVEKYKVENILERYLEDKKTANFKFKITHQYLEIRAIDKMQYSFIEYMAYRLKKYGRKASAYMQILEEQIEKLGSNISDVIKKEHFDIAIKKVSIGNCITSIKDMQRMNFRNVFTKINSVEEILSEDPVEVYSKMDFSTKEYYLNKIKEISKKTKISEIYIAKRVLELAKNNYKKEEVQNNNQSIDNNTNKNNEDILNKKAHVGYYLIDDGYQILLNNITGAKVKQIKLSNLVKVYILGILLISVLIETLLVLNIINKVNIVFIIFEVILSFIAVIELVIQVIQYVLTKNIKPKLIPKIDYTNGIPANQQTMVVIPTILKSRKKVKELMEKLEVYYIANKSDNIYFTLLGDCSKSNQEIENFDEEIIDEGIKEVNRLNKKYMNENINSFPIFNFVYRKRKWNQSEDAYLGWERKRGLLTEFTEYILGNIENPFRVNTIENININKELNLNTNTDINTNKNNIDIKYIITLDSDTNLSLESAFSLIGAMSHILNKPEFNEKGTAIIKGYGIMQPKIGVDLNTGMYNEFTRVYAGQGGVDSYVLGTSDLYQDIFREGIFTGKGIYDTKVYLKVLNKVIPENTVLSHDLLEGSYLRCGYVSDVQLLDDYPTKYLAHMSRIERWTRGDFQIGAWLKKRVNGIINPINCLSKFKIFDNLRRSILPIIVYINLIVLILSGIFDRTRNNIYLGIYTFILVCLVSSNIINILNYIIFKKYKTKKMFVEKNPEYLNEIVKGILTIGTLPFVAYLEFIAICKAEYRKHISKKKLLEWTTSEDAQNNTKNNVLEYYKKMSFNIITSLILGIFTLNIYNGIDVNLYKFSVLFILILWTITPYIMWHMSMDKKQVKSIDLVNKENKKYVLEIGKKTWEYFENYMIEENNFLPPDNYQEDRKNKIVNRTSSTNIGLSLISIISAYDLKYITKEIAINQIENVINTIRKLEKWNGHLYNWYNIKTLMPLYPRYISTVDSGNFIGYLYVTKSFLTQQLISKDIKKINYNEKIINMINEIDKIIKDTDFKVLYNNKIQLFSIGFNVEENKLTNSYYDLLASEARQASIVAIAKKDISLKHFKTLSRTLTILNNYLGLISWSGTAFEYLMPNINIPKYPTSLLDESSKFMIYSQEKYSEKLGIPWGISESAYNLKDLNSNYQYKAFGIPWLGLKRGLADEMVVSSYGSILAIPEIPNKVIKNIKRMEREGIFGKYGMYESIDYTPERLNNKKPAVVKTYMAHHQGLILASINNLINDNILKKRFLKNPEIKAIDILLQERMPKDVLITKEKKEKVGKIKYPSFSNYGERIYKKIDNYIENTNVISNDKYTICMDDKGNSISKYKDIYVNRYKSTNLYPQGIFYYIKNLKTKEVWNSIYNKIEDNNNYNDINNTNNSEDYNYYYSIDFMPDRNKFTRINGDIESTTNVIIAFDEAVEIRKLKLTNRGNQEQVLEVTNCFEPVLSSKMQDYSHPSFNNLFLKYEYENGNIIIKRNKKNEKKDLYMGVTLYSNISGIGDLEYEIDKEKVYESGEINIPRVIRDSVPLSKQIGLVVSPIVVLKRIVKIKPMESIKLNLIISVDEDKENVEKLLEKYKNIENIKRTFELSRVRVEEENRYLGINQSDINNYQKMLQYLVFSNPAKEIYFKKLKNLNLKVYQSELWKFGISGDIPILLCVIRNIDEMYMIREILKAYEYFKSKNIEIDIVFFNKEEMSYDQYLKHGIESEIINKNLMSMKNIKGGIFNISRNEITGDDVKVLETRADLIIDAEKGNLTNILKDIEDEYKEYIYNKQKSNLKEENQNISKNIIINKNINDLVVPKVILPVNLEETLYYNGYGGFIKNGKEYVMRINKDNKLKNVWSNVLANPNFGVITTQNMGGYIWNENSRLNRLTVWNNNSLIDLPSEIMYIYDKEYNKLWTINSNITPSDEDYFVIYGYGYSKYLVENIGITQNLEIFVPKEDRLQLEILKVSNRTMEKRQIRIVKYLRVVLGEDEIFTNRYICLEKDNNLNAIKLRKIYGNELNKKMYVFTNENIVSYTGNKKEFIGKNTIKNPEGVYNNNLGNSNGLGEDSCIAIAIDITLNPYEQKEIIYGIGEESNDEKIKENILKYQDKDKCMRALDETKQYWNNLINNLQVKTPVDSMNIMLNGWLVYQIIVSRLFAKSGYNQSGGAIGFRDQLQDTLGIKFISPEFMKKQLITQSEHQFIEGDVEHWWHDMTKMGIRTRFSDDLLWLAYVLIEYVNFTVDYSILNIKTSYIVGDKLKDIEVEKYDKHEKGEIQESLLNHALRAIDKSLNFGENGLPKIGSGDWNDGFSNVGIQGKGESVWLGFFLYYILDNMILLLENNNINIGDKDIYTKETKQELIDRYKVIKDNLRKKLNINAWDGQWYKRAFTDNGEILGSIENDECRIDSIAQSWSIISNAGDNDKKYICMDSLEKYLVDKENGIIKLFDPPFEKGKIDPGYIKSYLPGVRENGGQYTHGAVWCIIAEAMLGFGDKAFEYFNIINPIEHSKTKEMVKKYKVEPYVIAADIYSKGNLVGRGGWTWYTGSASWYYKAGIEYILGLKIDKQYLSINPCIPSEWEEYEMKYKYNETMYNIKVKNPNRKNKGVDKFFFNGKEVVEKRVVLFNNKSINDILIIM